MTKILDELHAARAKLFADAGGDLRRYFREPWCSRPDRSHPLRAAET